MSGSRLAIAYFGTPQFSVPTLERLVASDHRVVLTVTQPDRPRGRGQRVSPPPVKEAAATHGIPVDQPTHVRDEAWIARFRSVGVDLGVVAAYGQILPQRLLDVPRLGFINVHASLLPRWRGAAPIQRALMAGDAETGVTIMRVVRALDAGPMLARASTPIAADDTAETLEARLAALGAALLVKTVDELARGSVPETPQDETMVTYAARLDRAESHIDWHRPADVIDRQIRGLQPWPLAVTRAHGRSLALLHSHVVNGESQTAPAGTVVRAAGDDLHVACQPGTVAITRVKPEGRRPMMVRDFLNGSAIVQGTVLD